MCRLLITTGSMNRVDALRLIEDTAERFLPSQPDGFGFAAFNEFGHRVAWGRYYDEYLGWKSRRTSSDVIEEGRFIGRIHTLIIHGRTSTNVLGVDYCHPYREGDTYLAHNGVLSWRGPAEEKPEHQNDSAQLLQWLESEDHPPTSTWNRHWSGWGAVAIMRSGRNLNVVKCPSTRLSIAARRDGDGYVLSTNPTDIPRWLSNTEAAPITSGVLEFDKVTGELVRVRPFEGFARRVWDERSSRAMGLSTTTHSPTRYLRYEEKQGELWGDPWE